jgi:hypothetical protein
MFFDEIIPLLRVPYICVCSLELHDECWVIVAVQHSTNYNHENCIWQLWDVTSRFVARALTQIRRRSLVAAHSLLPSLPNLTCTFLEKHLHPLSANLFGFIEVF